jgi:hypothetical protein
VELRHGRLDSCDLPITQSVLVKHLEYPSLHFAPSRSSLISLSDLGHSTFQLRSPIANRKSKIENRKALSVTPPYALWYASDFHFAQCLQAIVRPYASSPPTSLPPNYLDFGFQTSDPGLPFFASHANRKSKIGNPQCQKQTSELNVLRVDVSLT